MRHEDHRRGEGEDWFRAVGARPSGRRSHEEVGFAETAASLNIPIEEWENQQTRKFVQLVNDARRLQDGLSEANLSRWKDRPQSPDEADDSGGDEALLYD
jgi:hypothetical protein